MCRKPKSNTKVKGDTGALPTAPWIYLNDPLDHAAVGSALASLIPASALISNLTPSTPNVITGLVFKDVVAVLATNYPDPCTAAKQILANDFCEAAIKYGCNFASVNVSYSDAHKTTTGWGTNHLEISAVGLTAQEIAEKIYKWLFRVLSVPETLHLIPEKEMLAIDTKSFPDYEYCPINESRKRSKDAKIQFVALVTSKPTVGANKKLHWTVADRSGVANFYFQYRGPESKYTWDWVLKLEPGDRKALPRMPSVQVHEKKRITVIKAPFRAVGFVVGGTGHAIKSVGHGLCTVGKKVKMGRRSEWVPEADVKDGRKVVAETGADKAAMRVFDEKGRKVWRDEVDGDASTTGGDSLESYYEKIGL